MNIFKKLFSRKQEEAETKAPEVEKKDWPLAPPKHDEDRHKLMNEYATFGIYCFISTDSRVMSEVKEINHYVVVLMENGYGERYATILKDGIVVTNLEFTKRIRGTDDWSFVIQPWLENKVDSIPLQDGIVIAELSDRVRKMKNQIEINKQKS